MHAVWGLHVEYNGRGFRYKDTTFYPGRFYRLPIIIRRLPPQEALSLKGTLHRPYRCGALLAIDCEDGLGSLLVRAHLASTVQVHTQVEVPKQYSTFAKSGEVCSRSTRNSGICVQTPHPITSLCRSAASSSPGSLAARIARRIRCLSRLSPLTPMPATQPRQTLRHFTRRRTAAAVTCPTLVSAAFT